MKNSVIYLIIACVDFIAQYFYSILFSTIIVNPQIYAISSAIVAVLILIITLKIIKYFKH
ncbi:hypothetical protein AO203_11765 (plasmid) [Lactobacillus gallinarum]|nr:hypothetical protein AO203_11730 [Lactobacillus gallinarum]ALJ24453.1 hypothetical protein AO203_11745 [Lactobacillus gallinarum]ALJ24456.1 hypothetical protein AO203_11765 [Lactobacillus gallinarum]